MNPRIVQLIARYVALLSALGGGWLISTGNSLAWLAGLLVAIGTVVDHYLHPTPAPATGLSPAERAWINEQIAAGEHAAPPAAVPPVGEIAARPCNNGRGFVWIKFLWIMTALFFLFGMAMIGACAGCGGSRTLSMSSLDPATGHTNTVNYASQGTDTTAQSLAIKAPGGRALDATGVNSNESTTAGIEAGVINKALDLLTQALQVLTQNQAASATAIQSLTAQVSALAAQVQSLAKPPPPAPPASQPAAALSAEDQGAIELGRRMLGR